ncbi:MAG: hypothetical protein RI553_11150, partial [Salibaculum sp.]|nr:hypothetical protein [Salibaculum sp.]
LGPMVERTRPLIPVVDPLPTTPAESLQRPDQRGDLLDYYLGPTGIPDRIRAVNELFNPIAGIEDAMAQSAAAADPSLAPADRRRSALSAAAETGAALLPVGLGSLAARLATPAQRALSQSTARVSSDVMETLTGARADAPTPEPEAAPQPAPVPETGAAVKPQMGEAFDDWIDRIYAPENRAPQNVVQDENVVFRAMSPVEAEAGEEIGVFRDLSGQPLYVANDPERYIGGGAYGGKRQGRIYEFDVTDLPSEVRQGGVGIQERAISEIPANRVRRVWEWSPDKQAHELIVDNTQRRSLARP